jgi:hypothetical protein
MPRVDYVAVPATRFQLGPAHGASDLRIVGSANRRICESSDLRIME